MNDVKRKFYTDRLGQETAVIAYLDLTNMFHWQDVLGWGFRVEDAVAQLRAISSVKVKDLYIDFGRFYDGKRTYKSENPAFGGTA